MSGLFSPRSWNKIWIYRGTFLLGLINTLQTAFVALLIALSLGIIFGLMATSGKKTLKAISRVYVEVIQNTPVLLQMCFLYYALAFSGHSPGIIVTGILALGIYTGAYMAETVRAGIGSIDIGQREGAWAMGMSPMKTMLYIVLPQAFKNIIPEMANTFLTNLKMTSVLNVIAVQELFMAAKTVGGNYYKYFESYLVIALIYFVLCFFFNKIFNLLEKKLKGKNDYALAVEYMDNQ